MFAHRLALHLTQGIGPQIYHQINRRFPDLRDFYGADRLFFESLHFDETVIAQLLNPDWALVDQQLAWAEQANCYLIDHNDPRYPAALKEINAPPPFLYIEGDLQSINGQILAIVGSRRATRKGMESAHQIASQLASLGVCISSGLAIGIDAEAHRGAIQCGKTVAVLGTGINVNYPKPNLSLKESIKENGAIITEFPLNMQPIAVNFPKRNRIISGLSKAVLVVEAAQRSGSLITARYAIEQNRDLMALPGSSGDPYQKGCNHLIKQGAFLVEDVRDIMAILKSDLPQDKTNSNHDESLLSPVQSQVLLAVDTKLTSVELIQQRSQLSSPICLNALSELALLGFVQQSVGGFRRCT